MRRAFFGTIDARMDFSALLYNIGIQALHIVFVLSPLWIPFLLIKFFIPQWLGYIRAISAIEMAKDAVLLEIKMPKEITKSPAAMEIIFTALHQPAPPTTYLEGFWDGKIRPWFSFELVSIEGEVHFYIWTPKKFKDLVEAQIYGQYPTVEIYEVEDYTKGIVYDQAKIEAFGLQYALSKPDPYPIKTYIDYGMDKDPKEEYKIDPMTATLEFLGARKQGEQVWIQIMVQAHRKEGPKLGRWNEKPDWTKAAKDEIKKIREESMDESEDGEGGVSRLTKGQMDRISAIERSIAKFPFDTMIRAVYLAEKDKFSGNVIGPLIGAFKQYNSNILNGFKPGWATGIDDAKLYGEKGKRKLVEMKKTIIEAYKQRSYFEFPYKHLGFEGHWYNAKVPSIQSPFILGTDELATIFHFPSAVAQTPTLARITSRKSEPPPNLPV